MFVSHSDNRFHIVKQFCGAKSISKALDILLLFKEKRTPLGVSDVCEHLNIPKATGSRILSALHSKGFLVRDEGKKYFLSPLFYSFAAVVSEKNDLIEVAKREMESIAEEFKETVHLNILDGGERLCIYVIPSPQSLKAVMPIGQRSPLHCGGSSKAILAFLDESTIEGVLSRKLEALTDRTITDRVKLLREIKRIREKGYAVSHGERVVGVTSISVPVFGKGRSVIGSLTVSIPTARHSPDLERKVAQRLLEASRKITEMWVGLL